MAFMDTLGQGLNNLTSTPMGMFGTQLLAQSGPQAGNPGGASRLGQALAGMGDVQARQMLQQYRQQMIATQQADQQLRQQAAQAKADEQLQWQQRLQDPNFLASLGPVARQFAQLNVDPRDLIRATSADNLAQHRQAQLQQQAQQFDQRQAHVGAGANPSSPKMPTPRQFVDRPLENGQMQRQQYNPQTQGYDDFGQPFSPHSTRGKAAQVAKVDPLEAIVQQATGGSNPLAAREGMRVPGQAKPATPMTRAEYDALPVGAQYVDPVSGKTATKKAR